MSKVQFKEIAFQTASKALIARCNAIVVAYQKQGFITDAGRKAVGAK